ncbi:MAG: hypothetical protein U0869_22865 [Chloroflexota bacterium]
MKSKSRNLTAVARVGVVVAALAGALIAAPGAASAHGGHSRDRDHDGLTNRFERTQSHTNPRVADTNGNGIPDGRENPDHDGLKNLKEQALGTDPLDADTDEDGLTDGQEVADDTDPTDADSDDDGLEDGAEVESGNDPNDADTDEDGIEDGQDDDDCDGVTNETEAEDGTDLEDSSDNDGEDDSEQEECVVVVPPAP